tara:strand:+ start:1189 stop:1812 length:624 start_codon:yes stop_codon:yes gene_type:complete
VFWLSILSHIGFFVAAFMLFCEEAKSCSINFFLFFTLTLIAYFFRSLSEFWHFNELSLITQAAGYLALMMEAVKNFKIKIGSPIMLVYFFGIIGLNIYLLLMHVFELEPYFSNLLTLIIVGFYYVNLAVLGVIAFLYYLNSYSKKSMFFISLVLSIVFADILRDMGVFYFKDISVEVAESVIRIGSAIFAVLFFITKEKKLQLINFV